MNKDVERAGSGLVSISTLRWVSLRIELVDYLGNINKKGELTI